VTREREDRKKQDAGGAQRTRGEQERQANGRAANWHKRDADAAKVAGSRPKQQTKKDAEAAKVADGEAKPPANRPGRMRSRQGRRRPGEASVRDRTQP